MGVTVTVGANFGLDMRELDFSSIWYADETATTSKLFRAYYSNGFIDEFRGTKFSYDDDGVPTGGTATSYAGLYNGQRVFTIDGASISVKSIVDASLTYDTKDDLRLIKDELAGADTFKGGNARDVMFGYGGNDTMKGNAGNDLLVGGGGNDKLEGGLGGDYLYGESGADTFIFRSVKESTVASAGRDTIFDFTSADHIDLRSIDASTKASGNQSFSFLGTKDFTGKAGEVRYEKKASDTYIYADTNGDKKADFAIHLDDAITLKSGFFLL
ncbi:hypothetical protein [Rhizobium sp. Leaf384]|uniref:calcium-binding protein n=1 Tax=Rhizobium sp. Leaf384 TaxID=1736358 RepID=UPI000A87E1DD|nr:hypothetical protein [Rhizobium sp. Leaf384]